MKKLDVLLSPSEFENLKDSDLSATLCVVFDVLRATSSMVAGLGSGIRAFLPAASIPESLRLHALHPHSLLAGERDGLRITSALTGDIDFDFGNSPFEFLSPTLKGTSIVMTTTNGTRAIQACAGAQEILIASFLNLQATHDYLMRINPGNLLLVCSGTGDQPAYEDVLCAGALVDLICTQWSECMTSDPAFMARRLFLIEEADLAAAFTHSLNGRRLSGNPQLHDDVAFCAQCDIFPLVAGVTADGAIKAKS